MGRFQVPLSSCGWRRHANTTASQHVTQYAARIMRHVHAVLGFMIAQVGYGWTLPFLPLNMPKSADGIGLSSVLSSDSSFIGIPRQLCCYAK